MVPRIHASAAGWLPYVLDSLREQGCAIVEGVVDESLLAATRPALYHAREGVADEVGAERLRRAAEVGVVRLPMKFHSAFLRYLELPAVLSVVDATLSSTAILHLQNGLILAPFDDAARRDVDQLDFHMDFRRVLNGYLCSINTLFAIDDFDRRNGATILVPGSHQAAEPPEHAALREHAVSAECPAGSMLVFDSTLWHAAGHNASDRDRLGLNQQFTRSYFKQQIDYVRALGDAAVLACPPRTQQLLGWYTRVAASLDEYYRSGEERFYRSGQG